MNLSKLIAVLVVSFFFNLTAEAKVIKAATLAEAIHLSNEISGKDSLYLSDFDFSKIGDQAIQYDIKDQLVLINDLGEKAELLKKKVLLKVAITGALQLVGFDFADVTAKVINLGKVSLDDCHFVEGSNLAALFNNKGLFEIKNGVFTGSEEGEIIRTAYFKVGARVIL